MNFQSARQISNGVTVAAFRKSNAADGYSGKTAIRHCLFDYDLILLKAENGTRILLVL